MERITEKREIALSALRSLQAVIVHIEQQRDWPIAELTSGQKLDQDRLMARDSLIQRFEYTVDAIAKYLKEYMRIRYGAVYQYPKEFIRGLYTARVITEAESILLLEMIDDRNMTSHSYLEVVANKIARRIPQYYAAMREVLDKTQ